MNRRLLPLWFAVLAACSVSERFLQPRSEWLGDPSAFGLGFEDVVLPSGDGTTVHGWFLPATPGDGRTVLFCHGNAANISFYHPYYRFLQQAGWNVFLFDYRGFGKSQGSVDVGALFADAELALDHLLTRPDVDPRRLALFGVSLGAIVTVRVAATRREPCGYVVENLSSPHRALRDELGAFLAWWVETFALPGGMEPAANAALAKQPALYVCGAWDDGLLDHLQAADGAGGPTSSWVMTGTGHAPEGLLRHDGSYQRAIVRFLDDCVTGGPPRVGARLVAHDGSTATVDLQTPGVDDLPLPVELTLVAADGQATTVRRWLQQPQARWQIPSPAAPRFVAAIVASGPTRAAGEDWEPVPSALTEAARQLPIWRELAALAANDARAERRARAFVDTIARFEAEHGPLPPLVAAELVPCWLPVARAFVGRGDAEGRLRARQCLQRCLAAEPPHPTLHYWPEARYVAGFRHAPAIAEARQLLEHLTTP